MGDYDAVVGAGSLRSTSPGATRFPHRWTEDGVSVEVEFTGAHLLHLAAAGCVLNDVYREAEALHLALDGVRVRATGGFDTDDWTSTGIEYVIDVETDATVGEVEALLTRVDEVAEIPRALRRGTTVGRSH